MQIIVVNFLYDGACGKIDRYLDYYFLLVRWAEALCQTGVRVTVYQRFHTTAAIEHNHVHYQLVADDLPPRLRSWQAPVHFCRQIGRFAHSRTQAGEQVIFHVNGLLFPVPTRLLRWCAPSGSVLVAQHHAEMPWRSWRRLLQGWGLRSVDQFLFTSHEQATSWIHAGIIPNQNKVTEVMEISSTLDYQARPIARASSRMVGNPIIFWAGNLNANKDPLTILAGMEQLLVHHPQAQLFMAYRQADLYDAVEGRLAASPGLQAAVTLLGNIPYQQIGAYYNSADLFVQGSHHEGSGVALLDALACGVIPIVTNIPSFRTITQQGRVGALFPPGDARAVTEAIIHVLSSPLAPQATLSRQIFSIHWSYSAIARRLVEIYAKSITTIS